MAGSTDGRPCSNHVFMLAEMNRELEASGTAKGASLSAGAEVFVSPVAEVGEVDAKHFSLHWWTTHLAAPHVEGAGRLISLDLLR
jgi:hypothetical protein